VEVGCYANGFQTTTSQWLTGSSAGLVQSAPGAAVWCLTTGAQRATTALSCHVHQQAVFFAWLLLQVTTMLMAQSHQRRTCDMQRPGQLLALVSSGAVAGWGRRTCCCWPAGCEMLLVDGALAAAGCTWCLCIVHAASQPDLMCCRAGVMHRDRGRMRDGKPPVTPTEKSNSGKTATGLSLHKCALSLSPCIFPHIQCALSAWCAVFSVPPGSSATIAKMSCAATEVRLMAATIDTPMRMLSDIARSPLALQD
jgi:hypothetical protein